MEEMTFNNKIEEIKKDKSKTFIVTPWEITNSFGYQKRSWGLADRVNQFLEQNEMELSGNFYQANFYSDLTLRHKKIATTKVVIDPIKRVDSLAAATKNKPIFVERNSSLVHAITLMQQHGYSQLPVVSGGERNLCGYISWKTIGLKLWHKKDIEKVSDCMETGISIIPLKAPLLDAIKTIALKKFVVVIKDDKTLSGIITASDIASEFFSITQAEAFLLLEQIELQIRILIGRASLLEEDLKKVCVEPDREVKYIDDLTFGEYQRIMENSKYWAKLNIQNDHTDFIKFIDEIRQIRNDVMHFEPDGIGEEKMQILRDMARYLTELESEFD